MGSKSNPESSIISNTLSKLVPKSNLPKECLIPISQSEAILTKQALCGNFSGMHKTSKRCYYNSIHHECIDKTP